jgi:hypothetical protein
MAHVAARSLARKVRQQGHVQALPMVLPLATTQVVQPAGDMRKELMQADAMGLLQTHHARNKSQLQLQLHTQQAGLIMHPMQQGEGPKLPGALPVNHAVHGHAA